MYLEYINPLLCPLSLPSYPSKSSIPNFITYFEFCYKLLSPNNVTQMCRLILWNTGELPWTISRTKSNFFFSFSNHKLPINNSSGRGVAFGDLFLFIIKVLRGLILYRSYVGNHIYCELMGEKNHVMFREQHLTDLLSISSSILSATFCWMFPYP